MPRGPVVRHQVAVEPILLQKTRIANQPEQESPTHVSQFKLTREPMLPSASATVL